MYEYVQSEPNLWTVGTYNVSGWNPESDHDTQEKAAGRVRCLNGGNAPPAPDAALLAALKALRRAEQTVRNISFSLSGDLKQIATNEAANLRAAIAQAEAVNEQ